MQSGFIINKLFALVYASLHYTEIAVIQKYIIYLFSRNLWLFIAKHVTYLIKNSHDRFGNNCNTLFWNAI